MPISRRKFLQTTSFAIAAVGLPSPVAAAQPALEACDVFIYGSTPGGIAAAIEAARGGCKVVLACPKGHAGGMKASGLCAPDAVRPHLFGGIVAEFFENVRQEYERTLGRQSPEWRYIQNGWRVEPSVAGQVPYGAMLPQKLDNLLVPVALSCTHVAMSVLRMEPLWMTTGQIAGRAAVVVQEQGGEVANLDPTPLPKSLNIRTEPDA